MVGELQCVSQPTDSTCVVRSWRLIDCFALTSAVRGFWDAWQCACVRYWPGRGLVYVCPLLYVCSNHNAVELSSIYFSSITVFHDTSKQIQQRAGIGKIFARWHLAAIAITSLYGKTWPAHSIAKSLKSITFDQITGKVTDVSRTHIPLKALIIPLKRVKFWGVV